MTYTMAKCLIKRYTVEVCAKRRALARKSIALLHWQGIRKNRMVGTSKAIIFALNFALNLFRKW